MRVVYGTSSCEGGIRVVYGAAGVRVASGWYMRQQG